MGKVDPVAMADEEKTFPELQERIAKTIAVLESVDPKSFEGSKFSRHFLPLDKDLTFYS